MKKKKSFVILVLCILLVFMGIGYALLSGILKIKGTGKIKGKFDVYIEKITPITINGDAESIDSSIGSDRLSASVDVLLETPGDYILYEVVVKNNGTVNVKLESADIISKVSNSYIKFSTTAVEGTPLEVGETMKFILKVEFYDPDDTFVLQDNSLNASTELQLDFVQTEVNITPNTDTDAGVVNCFILDTDGVIIKYNYGLKCSNNVSIPAMYNSKSVTGISRSAFKIYNLKMGRVDEIDYAYVMDSIVEDDFKNVLCSQEGTTCTASITLAETLLQSDVTLISEAEFNQKFPNVDDISYYYFDGLHLPKVATHRVQTLDLSNATNLTTIEEYAFEGYEGYAEDGDCGTQTEGTCNTGTLTSLTFPSMGNLIIDEYAFIYNNLTTLNIPSNVTLSTNAFAYNKLTSLTTYAMDPYQAFTCNPSLNSTNITAIKLTELGSFTCPK